MADDDRVARTATALEANGISVVHAANAGEAKRIVLDLVPPGAQVHNGASSVVRITQEQASLDTRHQHPGFDNLWYAISGSSSTGHSTGPGGAM
jgi:hypothetical protein